MTHHTHDVRGTARLLAVVHASADFYQGAVAALVAYLVTDRGYGYAQAADVVLASSLASSVVQPLFGLLCDRWRMRWLVPGAVLLAGSGLAGIAWTTSLAAAVALAAVSGIGVAAFHPAGARHARGIGDGDHLVMSWFSLGGNVGFAIAPIVVAGTVGVLGLRATPLLMAPALLGAGIALATNKAPSATADRARGVGDRPRDDWRSFGRLSVAIALRAVVFAGIGSFLALFVRQRAHVGQFGGSAALFLYYLGGAFGTAIGGRLAQRWPRTVILRTSYLAAVPVVAGLLLVPGPAVFLSSAALSVVLYVPFSLQVSLGQDYLPNRIGTASGVTLGLAVSVGGLAAPLLGSLADRAGLLHALLPLAAVPALAAASLVGLLDPRWRAGAR